MAGKWHGDAQVDLPSGEWASVIGRNGTFTPKAVRICQGHKAAHVEALGARGKVLNAGMSLPVGCMDVLAMRWLQSRGLVAPVSKV